MILTYADGSRTEAILLARSENKIRVALPGSDDPVELTDIHGTWVSADCVCSQELADRLLHLLWNGSNQEEVKADAPSAADAAAATRVVGRARSGN
jgi:hypothetical protein